jgi:magnesium transporter
MVSIYHYIDSVIRKLTIKELGQGITKPEGIFWIDLENPDDAEEETLLVSLLDFHPLSIEDAQRGREEEGHLPKVEDFGDYLFVILNPVEASIAEGRQPRFPVEVRTSQLSAYLSDRVLVTHHYKSLLSISSVVQFLNKNPQILGRGPDYLFQLILDDIVDGYTPILDALDTAVNELEREVFREPTQRTMVRILQVKRVVMTVRRIAVYQREMLNRLSRGEFALISSDEMVYYRNVHDHLVRMTDLAESYRDVVAGLLDAYLSVTSNKLSQVMKVLTIISTIFLPLGFITGFFGMNFRYIPGLESEYGVFLATLFMLVVGIGMLWIFRRNKWM